MLRRLLPALFVLTAFVTAPAADIAFPLATNEGQPVQLPAVGPDAKGDYPKPPEAEFPEGKKGEFIRLTVKDSKIYPGIENEVTIYVPTSYTGDKPACLYLKLDGISGTEPAVYENLIAKKEVPMTILVGVAPGTVWKDKAAKQPYRFNRTYEFDSMNGNFADYLEKEILPLVEQQKTTDGRPVRLSHAAADCAIGGASTGGIGSFTVAWQRPDLFSRVFSMIGTFVSMRGGHEYPALIRKTDPKPLRVFLEDGTKDAWNPLFGSWFTANLNMEAALTFSGYDVAHLWGEHAHDHKLADAVLPDIIRWLWHGWPEPVKAGVSNNDMLKAILAPNEGWQLVADNLTAARGLTANAQGEVVYQDGGTVCKIADGKPQPLFKNIPPAEGMAFGPNGTLYAATADKIIAIDPSGAVKDAATGIKGKALTVINTGDIFVAEPATHSDEPSTLWVVKPNGEKTKLDTGLSSASGIAVTPDKWMVFASEAATKWIYTYVLQPDGTLADKQRYFWLHMTDIPNDSGAGEMCFDTRGDLYVATRMGIQVCDRQGRVRAILTLPPPFGAVRSICFGGPGFDTLFATDGRRIFQRKMAIPGFAPWAPPITLSPYSGG